MGGVVRVGLAVLLLAPAAIPGVVSESSGRARVAVVDSGIEPGHREFCEGQIRGWRDFVHGRANPYDDLGHGTAVASRVGGRTVGVFPCVDLLAYKVLDAHGRANASLLARAIRQAVRDGADVVNLSAWSPLPSPRAHRALADAIDHATDAGVLVVWIAGNGGRVAAPGGGSLPGPVPADALPGPASPQALVVGVAGPDGDRAPFTQRDPEVLAPGVRVDVAWHRGGLTRASGTSFAAPVLAGSAARLLADGAPRDPSWLKWVLLHSARDEIGDPYLAEGYGLFDGDALDRALAVARGAPVPAPDHRDGAHLASEGVRTAQSGHPPAGALPPRLASPGAAAIAGARHPSPSSAWPPPDPSPARLAISSSTRRSVRSITMNRQSPTTSASPRSGTSPASLTTRPPTVATSGSPLSSPSTCSTSCSGVSPRNSTRPPGSRT